LKKLYVAGLFLSHLAMADSGALSSDFSRLVRAQKLGALNEQAFCYLEAGSVRGFQVEKLQRIASVTKLFTTYHATETLDLHRRYETRIFVTSDELHIAGGSDPYFEEEKLLLLMRAMNDLGYRRFKRVTFDRNFLFFDQTLNEYYVITPERIRSRLAFFLSSRNATAVDGAWRRVKRFSAEEGVNLTGSVPSLSADSVLLSDINPLTGQGATTYVHRSKPLHSLLKTMNVQSKNLVAELIYKEATRTKPLSQVLREKGILAGSFQIYNGSGLPIISGNNRQDNVASCRTVLRVISLLGEGVRRQRLALNQLVAVNGGADLGSFRSRFRNQPETHGAVISKTGTLKNSSTLAGVLLIGDRIPFAILNHTSNMPAARNLQDQFVARMFHHLGTPTSEAYEKISIFPWDGSPFFLEPR
jgi:D-alanyl-D-alanine carboxypeptidase/D-alanyl-D-alanine-endopeptidase (penicillin-binding protein 4)